MTADEEKHYEGNKTEGGLEGQGRSGAQPREVTPGYERGRGVGAGEEHSPKRLSKNRTKSVRPEWGEQEVGAEGVGAEVVGYTGPCRQRGWAGRPTQAPWKTGCVNSN